jgi:hypothetical protein
MAKNKKRIFCKDIRDESEKTDCGRIPQQLPPGILVALKFIF